MGKRENENLSKQALRELREDVDRRIGSLRARIDEIRTNGKKAVLERRLLNLALVFVVGFAFGAAVTRSARHSD